MRSLISPSIRWNLSSVHPAAIDTTNLLSFTSVCTTGFITASNPAAIDTTNLLSFTSVCTTGFITASTWYGLIATMITSMYISVKAGAHTAMHIAMPMCAVSTRSIGAIEPKSASKRLRCSGVSGSTSSVTSTPLPTAIGVLGIVHCTW